MSLSLIDVSANFEADYYGSQMFCYFYLNGNYIKNEPDYLEEELTEYIESNVVDEVRDKGKYKKTFWVLKKGQLSTGKIQIREYMVHYNLSSASLPDASSLTL